jgi:fumarate reductase subunit C
MRPRPYKRPMAGWWKRDPFFVRYMWREATALGVAAYAIVLLAGLWRLSQGEAAFNAWLQALRSAPSLLLHALLLVGMVYHALSWFQIMPKTMPLLFVRGERVAAATITRTGLAAAAVVSLAVLAIAWGVAR